MEITDILMVEEAAAMLGVSVEEYTEVLDAMNAE